MPGQARHDGRGRRHDRPRRHRRAGRWGRSLVNAVHGKTDAIRFTAAYTRTRGERRGLLPREGHPAARPLRGRAGEPRHRRGGAGDAAQPARRAGDGRGGRRQAHPCREAADARPAERRGRGRGGEARRHRAGGRLQPALSSERGRDPEAARRRPARPGDVDGGDAHHLDRAVHRRRQLARAAGRGAGRRAHRGRRAFDRRHDRVRRRGARRAGDHRPLHPGPVGRHHQRHAALQERRDRAAVLLGRDRDEFELHPVRHQGARGILQAQSGAVSLRAGVDRGADRAGHRAAGRDHRDAGVRHAQRRAGRVRALHRAEAALPGRRSTRCCTAWRCSTPWYRSGQERTDRESRASRGQTPWKS